MAPDPHSALALWPVDAASVTLAAQRENHVYRVEARDGCSYALRFHRRGYRSHDELVSELQWMAALAEGGMAVPAPCPAHSGQLIETVSGYDADLLTWLDGRPSTETILSPGSANRVEFFAALGGEMARLHHLSDSWTRPASFTRPAWDIDGLLGETPLWGRFWDNPSLSTAEKTLLERARALARAQLDEIAADLDYGLIHADMVPDNILLTGAGPAFIDFDDGGFGFRLFEIATALFRYINHADYGDLRAALLENYRAVRPIDDTALDLFLLLRAFTYLGWIVPRMEEPGAAQRNTRFRERALRLATAYLAGQMAATAASN